MPHTRNNVPKLVEHEKPVDDKTDQLSTAGRLLGVTAGHSFDEVHSAAMNMAIDAAMLESVDQSAIPCLRLYRWDQSDVVAWLLSKS